MENVQTKTFPFFSEKHKINNYANHVNNSHTRKNSNVIHVKIRHILLMYVNILFFLYLLFILLLF